jgi:ketosteroid isomerase-like protein
MSAPMKIEAAVLQSNATFYQAFSSGDYAAMNELWAERAPVTCLHPAAPALVGRKLVLESWRQILREAPPFELRCDQPVVHVVGDAAIVTCYEGDGQHPAHLAATNVFVLEEGKWRMVHHHAGPLSTPIPKSVAPAFVN